MPEGMPTYPLAGEDTAMSQLMLSVMGAFAEFERSLLKERQPEGIAIAKKAGVYKGRKRSLTSERVTELHARISAERRRPHLPASSASLAKCCITMRQSRISVARELSASCKFMGKIESRCGPTSRLKRR
jgi:DNA invertase Pin-like site-specific DNA recombinase